VLPPPARCLARDLWPRVRQIWLHPTPLPSFLTVGEAPPPASCSARGRGWSGATSPIAPRRAASPTTPPPAAIPVANPAARRLASSPVRPLQRAVWPPPPVSSSPARPAPSASSLSRLAHPVASAQKRRMASTPIKIGYKGESIIFLLLEVVTNVPKP
jgi:hypothetical protein